MNRLLLLKLLALALLLGEQRLVQAQGTISVRTTPGTKQPQLPTGGGTEALAAALTRNFRYPAQVLPEQVSGILHLHAVVTPAGKVARLDFDRPLLSDKIPASVYEAIRAAFNRLPVLRPGQSGGQPVETTLRVKWSFVRELSARRELSKNPVIRVEIEEPVSDIPDLSDLSGGERNSPPVDPADNKVYTYVETMPRLPGTTGPSLAAICDAVQRALIVPTDAVEGRLFVSVVVEKQGQLSSPTIVKGLNASTDAAALAAVSRLPTLVPGQQHGYPMRVRLTLPITIRQPAKPSSPSSPMH